jgi:3'-5' exoribonuclease
MSAHVDLASLGANTYVDEIYGLVNPQLGTTRAGKTFLKCLLRDASGEMPARQWSCDERSFAELERAPFVRVAGHSQLYNGQVQFVIEKIAAIEVGDEEMAALLPTTKKDVGEMFAGVRRLLESMAHPAMRGLADVYLADEVLMQAFRRAPAGVSVHHAWIGGLLEHTHQMMEAAERMLPLYPGLNRDLVLMGIFLHDLGKTTELTWEKGFDYTADGNLVGHVVRGAIWLQVKAAEAARRGAKLPREALRALQHIVLSHHGEQIHGAAKSPSTPEAIFVAQLDNLDAKTAIALSAADRAGGDRQGEFTDRLKALGTRIYRKDPLAGPPAEEGG